MTLVIKLVVTPSTGNAARSTREKLQPFEKAKANPEKVIANAKMMVPIFSPSAFYIAKISFPTLAESSDGLVVSNQEQSYLRIASTYLVLVFLAILSLNIRRKA